MRRYAIVLLVAVAGLVLPSGASAAGVYIALGDSVTYGLDASDPATKGFVGVYYQYLKSRVGVDDLRNEGTSGHATANLLAQQLPPALAAINDPATDAKAVTVEVGVWDDVLISACTPNMNQPSCPFAANLASILDQLNAALANDPGREKLAVVEYPNPVSDPTGPYAAAYVNYANRWIGPDGTIDCRARGLDLGLNDLIACVGVRKGYVPIDTYSAFAGHPEYLSSPQTVHPTDAGHAAIAALLENPTTGAPPPVAKIPPTVTTGTATDVGSARATISGLINPNGFPTKWRVRYGPTTSYGQRVEGPALPAADVEQPVSLTLTTSLRPATTYHYQIVADNRIGRSYGADLTLTTSSAPSTVSWSAGTAE